MKKLLVLLIMLLSITPAYAHPGSTDYKGGHTDRSTGKYHYHHGYSAHQHENGVCPYDFDDNSDRSSGSSSSSTGIVTLKKSIKDKTFFDYFMSAFHWALNAFEWLFTYGGMLIVPIVIAVICILTVFFKVKDFFSR